MGTQSMKGVWKSARVEHGALCVMTSGILQMPRWPADSWDSPVWVQNCAIDMSIILYQLHTSALQVWLCVKSKCVRCILKVDLRDALLR